MTRRTLAALLAGSLLAGSLLAGGQARSQAGADYQASMTPVAMQEAVDWTWAGHRVNQVMMIKGGHQLIAYYDANRQLTLAHRNIGTTGADPWRFYKLDTWVGWDSHNSPAVGIDERGHIHVMANMHVDQMVYFRSERPWDVRSMKHYDYLVNAADEARVTYPHFMNDAQGALIAKFRVGSSGDGAEMYNRYDSATKRWKRLHDTPLVDGEGKRNGYFIGPDRGPDGYFHLVWVWRETPSADTNHDLTYARSRDLVRWEKSDGTPLKLPMRLGDAEIVDPVPVGGGMLNGQTKLGFDKQNRPMIAYYKRDAAGDHQIYLATLRDGRWRSTQITRWKGLKLDLARAGSLALPLSVVGEPGVKADGAIHVRVMKEGKPINIRVDAATLRPLGETPYEMLPPAVVRKDVPAGAQTQVVRATDDQGRRWFMTWNALPSNQDRARTRIAEPSTLMMTALAPASGEE